MLYHVSHTPGIAILEPRVSSHGKPYVYAIENLVTGLLFGVKKDDFDFCSIPMRRGRLYFASAIRMRFRRNMRGKAARSMR